MRALIQGLRLPVVAVICHAAMVFAQAQGAAPPVPGANQTISGTVVNSVTGEPVRRALVSLGGQYSMLTDGDGRFEFHNLPNIQASINVQKPGFFNEQEIAQGQPPENLVVQSGPDSQPVVAKLFPEGVVFGHIDSEAGPVEGIQVRLIASRIREGRRRWESQGAATTDEDGAFRIANLIPGSYYLSVGPNWNQAMAASGVPPRLRGYPQLFYPGVPELSSAAVLEVAPGQQIEADISAKLSPVFDVSGAVSGFVPETGVSLQFATTSGELSQFPMRFDDTTGNFSTKITPGPYILKARAQTSDGVQVGADLPIEVTGDLSGIRLTLSSTPPIAIHVRTVSSSSPSRRKDVLGRKSANESILSAIHVELSSAGMTLSPMQFAPFLQGAGREQSLSVRDVEPGKYRVNVQSGGSDWYVASVQCGDVDLLRDPLEVHSGTRLPPIDVELRDDGAQLRASMFSEGSAAAGWVLLVPSRAPDQTQATPLAMNSQAIFQNLAPGEYSIIGLDYVDGLEYRNPDALGDYMGQATHVVLAPGQDLEMKLEMVHKAR
jgi:hypothetical protein